MAYSIDFDADYKDYKRHRYIYIFIQLHVLKYQSYITGILDKQLVEKLPKSTIGSLFVQSLPR